MTQRAIAIVLIGLALAGCGGHAARPSAANAAEWKGVIRDAYDGHLDRNHSCAAVRKAITQLPGDKVYNPLPGQLRAYEKKVC
jgi:hypothetical protein